MTRNERRRRRRVLSFMAAVNDTICEALHNAFDCGYRSALRSKQERNDWICTLKCMALMDEGICSHGGLCCLYESQRTIKENEPLTLDELRQMDGEPVWVCFIDGVVMRDDGWFILALLNESQSILEGKHPVYKNLEVYGKTWLAYRQKPEEGTR